MAPTLQPYNYSSLYGKGKIIRLVKLLSGDGPEIEIMISRAINNKKLEYEALSYVWGSPERTREVIVRAKWPRSNKVLRISKNLSTALRYLRQQDEERILWVDAICINQDDLNERSKEVKMMGSIYKNARRVVVWLGEGDEHSSLAMETLEDLGNGININDVSAAKYNLGFGAGSTAFQLEKTRKP